MNAPGPPAPSVPFDLDIERLHPTATLDLDTMARIAETAGRDAFLERGAFAAFDVDAALRDVLTDNDAPSTAARLYRACLRGATDPATD